MRILHVTHRFLPHHVAGTEVYAAALCRGLRERGHTQQIFTGDPEADAAHADDWEGLPVHAIPWGVGGWRGPVSTFLAGFFNPAVERRFAQVYAEFQPEVVHVHHLMGLSPALPAIARRHGARVVVTLHDYWFVCSNTWLYRWHGAVCPGPGWGYYCGGCAAHRLGLRPNPLLMTLTAPIFVARTAVLRRALLTAHRLIAPSQIVARLFARHGVPPERIAVVPHGLTEASPAPARADDRPRSLRFVYVGSLIRPKGAHIAIQAFDRVSDPRAQFHLYGDLTADPGYTAELRGLAHHPGIEFKGPVARDQVKEVLLGADILLLPSLWYEAFSIIVDEALQAGLPALASDHGAPAERIVAEVNGLTAPPGDVEAWQRQMQRLVDDPALIARLSRGIQPPKRLTQHAADIETLYARLLRGNSEGPAAPDGGGAERGQW
jgi:glycosyltransferase involved in cell wall biosynthesis